MVRTNPDLQIFQTESKMKHRSNIIAMAVVLSTFSCNLSELGVEKADDKQDTKSEGLPLSAKLEKNGYYLDFTRFDESKIPAELKDKVAVFQIALQSGDQPVLGGRVEAFEPGNCPITDVPWATASAEGTTGIATATIASPASEGTPAGAALTADAAAGTSVCADKKIEQFGPNDDSNFFSIVIKKSRIIALNVFANGYQSKIVTIDGSKAKFIVLNVDLGLAIEPCYFSQETQPDSATIPADVRGPDTSVESPAGAGGSRGAEGTGSRAINIDPSAGTTPWVCGPIMLPPGPVPGPVPVPRACEEMYAPVCAYPGNSRCGEGGMLCPQIAPAPTTFENKCTMENAGGTIIHDGKCTAGENPLEK
jgi:hypothetical protein